MKDVHWNTSEGEWFSVTDDEESCDNAAKSDDPEIGILAKIVKGLLDRVNELERRNDSEDNYRREQNERG